MSSSVVHRFGWWTAHTSVLLSIIFLSGSLWIQFYQTTLPEPIIVLHRMAIILAVIGHAFILQQGVRHNQIESGAVAAGLGMTLLGSSLASAVVLRQLIFFYDPLKTDYGITILGQPDYIWIFCLFFIAIIDVSIQLLFGGISQVQPSDGKKIITKILLTIFMFLILAHGTALFFQSGINLFLENNPSDYLLIKQR